MTVPTDRSMPALEQAARAILIAEGWRDDDADLSGRADVVMLDPGPHCGDCTKQAHTCLRCERERVMATAATVARALREPDEAMLEAMLCASMADITRNECGQVYRAAIDSLLAEQPTPPGASPSPQARR